MLTYCVSNKKNLIKAEGVELCINWWREVWATLWLGGGKKEKWVLLQPELEKKKVY